MILFIFGDSITQGYWDKEGGWADKLKAKVFNRDLDENYKYYHGVHNLGVDGNITQEVIGRFDSEVKARLWRGSEYGIIFSIGINDTSHRSGSDYISTPEKYRDELEQLYKKARGYTTNIAFINITPVDEELTNPFPLSSTGKCFTNDRIEVFNNILKQFCNEHNVELIDAKSKFLEIGYKKLLADGIHPNSDGHNKVLELVTPVVNSWLYS